MSDHPTPATPEATEREARELFQTANAIAMSRARLGLPTLEQSRAVYAALDAYRAAVAAVESERGRRAEREARGGNTLRTRSRPPIQRWRSR